MAVISYADASLKQEWENILVFDGQSNAISPTFTLSNINDFTPHKELNTTLLQVYRSSLPFTPTNNIEPSQITLSHDASQTLMAYDYINKKSFYRFKNFEQHLEMQIFGIDLEINNREIHLKRADIVKLVASDYNTNELRSYYVGSNANNKQNKLRLNNEIGYGYAYRFNDKITSQLILYTGIEGIDVYIKPEVKIKYEYDKKNSFSYQSYYKSYENYLFENLTYSHKLSNTVILNSLIEHTNKTKNTNSLGLSINYKF